MMFLPSFVSVDVSYSAKRSFNSEKMDIVGSKCHLFDKKSSIGLETIQQEQEPAFPDDFNNLFINYAAVAWHEMRRAWRGDESRVSHRMPTEPIMRSNTTYEELLLSKEPFDKPVPLSGMVQFLVETWEEEGLYD